MRNVFRASVQDLAQDMSTGLPEGGDVPVKSGNMARSVMVQEGSMPNVVEGATFAAPDIAAAQTLEIGDTAYIGYQAIYARRVNHGFVGTDSLGRSYNQAGAGFVEKSAARWPQIVEVSIGKVKQEMGS